MSAKDGYITVGQLIESLRGFDPTLPICGTGHYGEALRLSGPYNRKVFKEYSFEKCAEEFAAVVLSMEDPGPEPT